MELWEVCFDYQSAEQELFEEDSLQSESVEQKKLKEPVFQLLEEEAIGLMR